MTGEEWMHRERKQKVEFQDVNRRRKRT